MSLPLLAHHQPARRHQRVRVDLSASLDGPTGTQAAVLRDISSGGLFCASDAPPRPGCLVTVHFRLLSQLNCHAVGRVVWSGGADGRQGFGVEFDATSKQMATFTSSLAKMSPSLRPIYLAGVVSPTITLD